MAFLSSGIGLTVFAIGFVGLRLLWIQLQHPAHFKEIANAFGSASLFHEAPQIAHSGDRFTFVKTSAHGYALYLCDATTGEKKILFEQNNYLGQNGARFNLQALPWSPDDSSFLCTIGNKLVVYPLDTNQPQSVVETNPVSDVIWLGRAALAYLIDETNLCYAQKQEDGKWERHELLSRSSKPSSLTAISEDTIAWLEDNAICRVNLTEGLPDTNSVAVTISATNKIAPPTDGLALWLDASKLKQPDKSSVMRLADLSASKNGAVLNGRPPNFNATNSTGALNGKPTIRFTSSNSTNGPGLKTHLRPGIIGSAPRSVFVVMRHDLNHAMMVNMGDTAAKGSLFGVEFSDALYLPAGWGRTDNRTRMASTNWNILEAVYDGTSEKGYVNGILRSIANNKLNTADKEIEIGLRTATGGKNAKAADGDFAELLVYDRALNFIERKQVENYLGDKWFGIKNKNPTAQNPYIWFVPPTEGLTSFSYSKESGQFLLNCTEARRGFLWQYEPQTATLTKVANGNSIQNEQWFGEGESAYFIRDAKRGEIILRDSFGIEEDRALTGVNVLWFGASDMDNLLVLGAISNQPSAAIWQYEVASKRLTPMIAYSDEPSVYAKGVTPTNVIIKTPSGNLTCTIYPPTNFNPRKKYPLVIGNTVFTDPIYRYQGPSWAPAIANCGGYVVIVERRNWFGGLESWGTNVMAAYKALKKDIRIDTSQIYLFGSSAETAYMDEVLTHSPGRWKGVILLNPSALPDLSNASLLQQRPKILISAGGEEHEDDRFKKYQASALQSGVMVEYVIHPGEEHHIVGNAAQLERTKAIMRFIFEE